MAHLEGNRRRRAQGLARPRLSVPWPADAQRLERWLPGLLVVAGLILWEMGAYVGLIKEIFFPAPSTIARSFAGLMADGTLPSNIRATVGRVVFGLVLGGVPGILLGLVLGWSRRLRAVAEPLIAAAHPIPKVAMLPLIMLVFGISEAPKIVIAAMGAFFPLVINTMAGVQQIHAIHFEVAQNYGASRRTLFSRVVLPGSLPMILTGVLLAANVTLLLTISVEMVSANIGLGAMIWMSWETMRVEELYVSLTLITLFGIGVHAALEQLRTWLVPWRAEREL